ncbi:hypothetical protein K788_0004237 (plasmid) [Paraburkholderia caribensis MBA4]|uniref:Uncharacterized protein n=1 Tax=Paraburkholderia caribensis MBA4 TaxID=1323664 RepID=A0A0P0RPT2_9BURK|nr:hypothetical protein K788_0004237 [Paraburkholderia caribensis MBA4]
MTGTKRSAHVPICEPWYGHIFSTSTIYFPRKVNWTKPDATRRSSAYSGESTSK